MDQSILLALIPLLLGLGVIVGFFAGLLGLGGGIILVPVLYYGLTALGFPAEAMMHMAVGTSLMVIIPTGIVSARAHWKRGGVRIDLLKKIGVWLVVGVVAGTMVADYVSGHSLKVVFACTLMLLAGLMNINPRHLKRIGGIPPQPWPALMGVLIGILSTLMGIGGATISVPSMVACRVPMKEAVGTAAAMGVMISIPAVIGFFLIGQGQAGLPPYSLGYVNIFAGALITSTSILAAPWGVRTAHRLHVDFLRRVFAVFLMLVALKMLYGVFFD